MKTTLKCTEHITNSCSINKLFQTDRIKSLRGQERNLLILASYCLLPFIFGEGRLDEKMLSSVYGCGCKANAGPTEDMYVLSTGSIIL